MTTARTGRGPATRFLVDGQEYGGGPVRFSFDWVAVAVFTAEPGAVARLLPSPLLHPVRWVNGRAVVAVAAGDQVMTIGELPPVRFAEVSTLAMVTSGRSPAVPVLPVAGALLPLVGGMLDRRYRVGTCLVADVTTNRVAAEVLRIMFGVGVRVGAVREDRGPDRLRFTATDAGGAQILSLEVPAAGRATPIDQMECAYLVAGSHLARLPEHATGSQTTHLGRSAARLHLGQHPLADQLRGLDLSPRPLLAIVRHPCTLTVDRQPERLAPAEAAPAEPVAVDPVVAPLVIGHEDGHDETVDQLLDQLPFDPTGAFQQPGA